MGRDLRHVDTAGKGVESSCNHDTRDVVDRDGVDSVDNAWARLELDTALEHTDQEVVNVAHAHVARSDNDSLKSAPAGLTD